METPLQDLKFALRLLWRDKGFATAVVLSLALCIGANVTIFTVVHSILLKPLPVKEVLINARFRTVVTPLQEAVVREARAPLYVLWGGVTFLLLIGCVNVANLLLIRSSIRLKELATRAALGAGRWRLSRQIVSETVLVTLAAGGLGLLLARLGLLLLWNHGLEDAPRGNEVAIDGVVVLLTIGLSLTIGCILGALPVANLVKADLHSVLRQESRSGTGGRTAHLFRSALVVTEVSAHACCSSAPFSCSQAFVPFRRSTSDSRRRTC